MSTEYKSAPARLNAPVERVYERFSNLENLKHLIEGAPADKIPADKLEQLKKLEVTPDTLSIPGGPTGAVTLRVIRREEPNLVELQAENLPMQLLLQLRLQPEGADATEAVAAIVADIPMMLRPMLKGPLQQVVDQFATMMAAIPFS